ncbi:MAG: S-methyl-5-thioribose-1-phosphate isomerase, partial [Candidatus Latescibacteria bacterium]|nr:S-methyl-5-thioribose-1-phosphate isomerase [Candidatus Latescibacterota bacterium]
IDQTKLPTELAYMECRDVETVAEAIESLRVRGAPAIGVAAAYGVVVGADEALRQGGDFRAHVARSIERLARTRPTAVNLFWALDRMRKVLEQTAGQPAETLRRALLAEANIIFEEDRAVCRQIGQNGMELLRDGATVITHCNAGGLATADYGTALAVIYAATEAGKRVGVYADETRPLLQGSRLTAWELKQSGIDVTVICDNMAGTVMRQKGVDCVIVGADRIAANGDVANKIGTYGLAILAQAHGIPFYVAAPVSTIDIRLQGGEQIPIEERKAAEVTEGFGRRTAPEGVKVFNPAFDVTPHTLITAIISERGIARPPFEATLRAWCA